MKHDDSVYLRHMLDAIVKIESYLEEVSKDVFLMDSLIQDGVIRQIEIVGEATKNLSSDLREAHAHLPWQDMAGMRDKLIHQYFGVDLDTVWLSAKEGSVLDLLIFHMLIPNSYRLTNNPIRISCI